MLCWQWQSMHATRTTSCHSTILGCQGMPYSAPPCHMHACYSQLPPDTPSLSTLAQNHSLNVHAEEAETATLAGLPTIHVLVKPPFPAAMTGPQCVTSIRWSVCSELPTQPVTTTANSTSAHIPQTLADAPSSGLMSPAVDLEVCCQLRVSSCHTTQCHCNVCTCSLQLLIHVNMPYTTLSPQYMHLQLGIDISHANHADPMLLHCTAALCCSSLVT